VPSGDGVYGLRRALVLAGAASQVVSLWSVSDASTRALMRDYYGELARGTGRAERCARASCACCTSRATRIPTSGLRSSRPATGGRWTRAPSPSEAVANDSVPVANRAYQLD